MDDVRLPNLMDYAVPAFIVMVVVEAIVTGVRGAQKHEWKDSSVSILMGIGCMFAGLPFRGMTAWALNTLYEHRLFNLGVHWWTFVLVILLDDFAYYWFHRASHECRIWWAAHVTHHSSENYNFSTALRQSWTKEVALTWLPWYPIALLGVPPALIFFAQSISMVYSFFPHTQMIGKLPRPIEWLFVTPSHHRVHHSKNPRYLDRNYGSNFIIWDRLFGTFQAEDASDPCRYGTVKPIGTYNPIRIAFHEWVAIARDVWRARTFGDRLRFVFGRPGWSPDGTRQTAPQMRAAWQNAGEPVEPVELEAAE